MKNLYSPPSKIVTKIVWISILVLGLSDFSAAQTISATCSGASQITVGNCTTNQNVSDATVNDPNASGCITSPTRDGWFYFVATSARTQVDFFNNSNRDAGIIVYSGSCGSLTAIGCVNATGSSGDELLIVNTSVGSTYRIRILRISGTTTNLNGSVCVNELPSITSFSPSPVCTGGTITITGSGFTGTTAVTVNGTAVTSFNVVSGTSITAVVAAGTTTGTINVTNGTGSGTSASSLTVNSTPVATATPSTQTLCGSGSTSVALSSSVGGTSYIWTVAQTNVSGGSNCASACGSSIAQSLSNINGTTSGSAVYTITPATASCTGSPITATITVNPKPVGSAANSTPAICSGTGPADALSSTVAGTAYTWTVSQSGVSGGSTCSSSCGTSINQTLTATGAVAGTATYTVTPTASSCAGNTFTVTVTVNPKPVGTATPSTGAFCGSGTTNINLSSTVAGTSYSWTIAQSNATGSAACPSACGTNIADVISSTSNTPGTVTYTITPATALCTGNTFTSTMTVNPIPTGTATPSTKTICSVSGPAIALSSTVSGTSYTWTVSQSGVSGGSNCSSSCGTSINQSLTTSSPVQGTATYTVTPTANGCPGSTLTADITVNPVPVATSTPSSQTICGGGTTGFALTSTVAGTNFAWTVVQTNVTGATAGSGSSIAQTLSAAANAASGTSVYTVTPTSGAGCTGSTITASATVLASPTAVSVSPSSITICPGANTSLNASGGPVAITYISGTGSSTTTSNTSASTLGPNPLQNYYGGSKQQTMWRSSELIALGLVNGSKINSITINLATAGTTYALLNYRIKYQLSSSVTALSTTPITTGWTTIYGPQSYTPVSGINTFTFSSPIVWDGTSALILEFNFSNNNTGSTGTLNTATYNTGIGYTATNFYRADNVTAASVDAFSSTVNFSYSSRNNVQFNVTQPVSYSWLPVTGLNVSTGTTVVASPASSTTYTVSGTLANGCSSTATSSVSINPAISISFTSTNVSCNGGTNGSATANPTGGNGSFVSYLWSNGQTTATATGLIAGTYSVTVTDGLGCTASNSVVVSEPTQLVASCSVVSHVTCNGGTDGSASVSASGGTAPYTGEGTFTGLAAGTYSYTITDANGCTASCSVTITEPAALVATCSVVSHVTCNGGTDGSASVSASGGTAPFTGEGTFTGLAAGTYSYTVTDANGCTASCSVTITEPAVLVATCTVVSNVSCNGGSDGAFNVSASGGTGPYTGTGGYIGAVAGTNTITVTDANGCTTSCSVTITEPSALSASCTWVSDVTCNGGNDGSATVSASGGTGPYTGTGLVSGLSAGTQTLTVTDANGCTATCTVVINQPSALVATCSVGSNVTCNGGSDGSASVSASGGVGPYTGEGTFTGLSAGTYSYTVTDASGCTATCSVTITEPAALVATCTVVSNVSCNGGSDGAFNVSASGGTGPYSGTGAYAGAVAGTNTITVTDANGCTTSCSVTITEPAVLIATCTVVSNVSCNGGSDGAFNVSASGGTGPYSGTGAYAGAVAGTNTITVTDANGCTATCTVTITEPSALSVSCTWVSDVTCNGGNDGSATVSASGGTGPYTGTGLVGGLSAGTQTLTVTDANGCTATCTVVINEPAALVASCSVVSHVTCNGGTDGSASVSASGGTAPYTGEGPFTGLAAGTYSYTITDANGCTASCSVTITEPAVLVATCTVVSNVSCNGGSDGAFNVSASGGTGPYSGTGAYAGAVAGTNTITVTDANGCTTSCSVTITEPAVLVATCTVVSNVSCNGGSDGAFNVSASGGTGPYTGTGSYAGAVAGTNTITVTDANGCTATCSVTITEPAVLVATCSVVSNVSCNGGTDGSASVSASGGTAPYSGTGSFTGLAAGTYNYTVTDANGCTASCSVTISEPAALVATCSVVSNVTCNGGTDGSASVSASGGTAPYSGEGTFPGLAAGTYNYTVTDANGCTASCSVTISEPAALVATCSVVSNVSCNGGTDGSASVSASGGTAPYSGEGTFSGLAAGTYSYTVTDANGCTASCSVTISEPAALVATCTVVSNVSCNGGSDGAFNVSASGGTGPYTGTGGYAGAVAGTNVITVTDANGCTATCSVTITEPAVLVATCSVVSNVSCNGGTDGSASVSGSGGTAPYSGTGSFSGLAAGTYNYTVTDANGCTASCSVTISEPAALVATCSVVSNVTCNGGTDGSASVSASGGVAPYSGEGTFTGLAAGTYNYTVTDANGCTASCSVTISEPAALVATCTVVSNVSCNGGSDGAFNVSASGGTGPYTGTGGYAGAVAGTNVITVTDANGCTATCSVTITEPAVLVATCSVVSNVSCNGGTDGSASVSASGGTSPYSGTGTFTSLSAGTYNYTVTDANGCTASCSVTITEPAALVATCSIVSNVTCNGGSDGSASVSASGGVGPYSGEGTFTGLFAGTYSYTVTDANGCTATCSVTITEPAVLVATCTVVSNVSCNGGSDGAFNVSASGGTGPYTGTGGYAGAVAGTNTITVTDANGCTATCSVTISEPAALVATCSVVSNVSCNGGTDGSASVSASGGTAPYSGTGSFTGLAAGTYNYTVTDANGCTASCSVTISEPAALVATCSVVSNVTCNGGTDGSASVSASGGTAPYSGEGTFSGLAAGTYNYTVTDANGCTASCSVTITEPAVLVATCSVVSNVSCNGGSDGAFNVSASGGTGPYTGTGGYAGAVAGTNNITVTDANGCTATCSVTITEPAVLVATCTVVSQVTCNGGTDGSASVSASGGTTPYTGEGTFTGLAAGTYSYTVTDANGCTASCSVTITEPAALVATCSVISNVTCNGGSDGSASVSASGGSAPYSGEGTFTGLSAGTYSYTVTDANGCTATCSVTITEPAALVATCTVVSNVSCNGGSDGAFNVSASGGTGPFTGTGGYAGAVAGTNTITVTDANGCTATCSVTITEPAALVATCTVVSNVSCNGGSDGAFNVSASGGTGPYTGTGGYAGAVAGTNTITVTDANGCTATCSVTITEPAALVATCSVVSNVSCNGGTDGSASVSASGGTAPYSGTGSFTGLAAGTYNYTVTDANGCTASCSVTISEPAALVATCSVVSNVTCNGGTDGSSSVSASGGTAPYSGEGTFPGLAAGTYNYTVTDANGCTASCSVTISEPAALVATCSVVSNVSCNGGTDGSASVSASGGTAPYSGEGTFSGLAAGTYSYTVTDANGCTASCSVTISEPAALVATCTVVSNVSCNGGSDGAFNVSASGGTGPYTGTGGYAGAVAGTNTITVTDANGCTSTCSVTITEPAALVATCSVVSNVSCNGGTDGSASVNASGGTSPYSGTGTFTSLSAGTYNYTVTDANGCTASCSVTITEPAALVATCSVVSNVTCNGGSDGSASVSASGGTAPYSGEGTFTGLAAGTYNYTVTDANGCTASCSVTITEPAALVATCTVVSNVSCNGGSDGAFNVSANGGTGPYTGTGGYAGAVAGTNTITVTDANGCTATCSVTITEPAALVATCTVVSNVSCNGGSDGAFNVSASGGTGPYTGTGSYAGAVAGTNNITVTDANGCTATCSVTITEPAVLVATCSVVSNVSCNGGTDGSASVSASGGTAPYSGEGTFTGLAAGTYNYTVTDANGCTASCSVTISEPAALVATCSVVSNVTCNGGTDGSASVSASGGTAPYSGEGTFTGLAAGTYNYTVTDANGCTASCSVTISEPVALVATCSVVSNVTCNGGTDGSASVSASGGVAPYSGEGTFTGLAAGTYNYTVTDANGCTASCSVTISEPAALVATCTVVSNVSCNGGSDGAFNVSASGGTGPYTGTGSYAGAVAGTNNITVTDANGCTATCSVTITEPAVLVATCSVVSNVSCNGGTDGSASVSASGGTAPYSGEGTFTGLAAGTYNYTVTDANGCTASCSVTISEPATLVATCSVVSNVTCNGGTDGSASVSASGGTAPYSGEGTFTGLAAGTYNYTVTDANGCTASCSVTISEPSALVATCSVISNVTCNGGTDGSASVSASGGVAPYSGEGTFTGLAAGTYNYTVTDANGCTASCSVTISEPAALVATCTVVSNVSCNGGSDGAFNVSASGGTGPYTGTGSYAGAVAGTNNITVTDANGCTATCSVTITEPSVMVATCSVVSNVSCNGGTDGSASVSASGGTAPYSGEGTFTGLAAGTYNYTVTDANGCTASCSVTISEPATLVATCSVVSNVTCNGGTDGSASVSASGGTAPYSGEGTFTGLAAGTYNYTVTDANGCTASCSVTISEPAALVATCSVVSNVTCNGGTDGSASVSASGGTAPYSGEGTFTGLAAGTYNYTVTDANGCTASCSVTISEPAALVATCTVVSNVSCNGGSDGAFNVSASGGTGPYTGTGSYAGAVAGTNNITVTDANGCTATCSVTITEPAVLVATCSVVSNVSCNGGTDGSASVSASGGTAPYSGTGSFSGLAAGTYNYTVTDANGCTASCSVTISEPAALVATCSVVSNVSCNGGTDGSASVSASGGSAPYSGTGSFTGLAAGTYNYTVTDANGCTASCSVTIAEPMVLSIVCTPTNETYPGANNGSVSILATGGTAPYSNDGLHSGLTAGTYTYTVTDANGCTTSCTTNVGTDCVPSVDPSGATASASEICLGGNVTLQVTGGSLGTGADWVWYEGGCGAGTPIGTGVSISVPVTTLGTHNYFVRAEGLCGTTICASVSVDGITVLPAPITILSAPVSGCIGGSGTVTCSSVAGASGYQWTAPSGVLINGVTGPVITASTTVTVTFTALPPTGISGWNICVSGINACGTSPNTKCYWIRATISTPSPIVGSVVGCPSTNGSYSVTPVDGAAQYVWTVTGTAGLNGGGATVTTTVPNVTINFGSGFTTGQLCVYAKTSCGYSGASRCLSIATAPGLPGAINGSTTICPGSSATYSITPVAGAASYLWTTTGTGVSVVGSGTSATVTTTSAFTSGSVCVVAVSACGSPVGNSAQRCKTIGTGKLATPGNITGDPTTGVCGQTYQYSIPSIAGATGGYLWSIPSGVTVIGPSNSNSITLQFPSNFVSGTICANGINACGNGFTRCVNVFGNPGTPTAISGNASVCAGSTEVYSWPSVPGATSYQVIVPAGSVILTGTPTVNTMAVITWGTTAGSIGVKAINGCGVSGTRTLPVAISCRTAQTVNESNNIQTTIYPNPAHGSFNVSFTTKTADNFNLKVVDQTGRIVKAQQINAIEGVNLQQLDASELAPGVYLVVLESKSGISKYPLMLQ